jgi:hypothetical protein
MLTEKEKAFRDRIHNSVDLFIETVDVAQLNKNLRNLVMAYLINELKEGTHTFFDEMVDGLWFLFSLLDDIEKEGLMNKSDWERGKA